MTKRSLKERTKRVERMNRALRKLFPKAKIELNFSTPWELMVAVQLSAQCTDKRVNEVTGKLFKKYPTFSSYLRAKRADFEKDIKPCGFYRNKTKNILGAATLIQREFGGKIPKTMDDLLRVPGVARKTANVILSNLYNVHEGIAVDTPVRRFAIRFDLSDYRDPVRIERDLMALMPKKEWLSFNHRLVHYGRHFCRARRHDCVLHPLTRLYPEAGKNWPKSK